MWYKYFMLIKKLYLEKKIKKNYNYYKNIILNIII